MNRKITADSIKVLTERRVEAFGYKDEESRGQKHQLVRRKTSQMREYINMPPPGVLGTADSRNKLVPKGLRTPPPPTNLQLHYPIYKEHESIGQERKLIESFFCLWFWRGEYILSRIFLCSSPFFSKSSMSDLLSSFVSAEQGRS